MYGHTCHHRVYDGHGGGSQDDVDLFEAAQAKVLAIMRTRRSNKSSYHTCFGKQCRRSVGDDYDFLKEMVEKYKMKKKVPTAMIRNLRQGSFWVNMGVKVIAGIVILVLTHTITRMIQSFIVKSYQKKHEGGISPHRGHLF